MGRIPLIEWIKVILKTVVYNHEHCCLSLNNTLRSFCPHNSPKLSKIDPPEVKLVTVIVQQGAAE